MNNVNYELWSIEPRHGQLKNHNFPVLKYIVKTSLDETPSIMILTERKGKGEKRDFSDSHHIFASSHLINERGKLVVEGLDLFPLFCSHFLDLGVDLQVEGLQEALVDGHLFDASRRALGHGWAHWE